MGATAHRVRANGASATSRNTRRQLAKIPTGVVGLDDVLRGGLPAGRMTLLSGGAGSGKSLIAMRCALHGATVGEPCHCGALRGTGRLRTSKRAEPGLGRAGARAKQEAVPAGRAHQSGSGDFRRLLDQGSARHSRPPGQTLRARHIVFDAVDTLLQLYDNPARERQELNGLHEWLLGPRTDRDHDGQG